MYAIAPATTADAPARHDGRRARAVRPHAAKHPLVLFGGDEARRVRQHFRHIVRHNRYGAIADLRHAAQHPGAHCHGAARQHNHDCLRAQHGVHR